MYDDLFRTTDPQGRLVRLTQQCYTEHIIVEHPDLTDVGEISRTVHVPDVIAQDALDDQRLVYYRTYRRRPQRWMIKVVVEGEEVVTAFRVMRMKSGEQVIWQR